MQIADEIGVKNLEAYCDSRLIVNQVRNATIHLTERFKNFYIDHVSRQQNAHANALASLVASLALPAGAAEKVLVYSHDLYCSRLVLEDD